MQEPQQQTQSLLMGRSNSFHATTKPVDDNTVSYDSYNSEDDDTATRNGGESESSGRGSGSSSWSLRRIAMELSLYLNLIITFTKLVAYIRTMSLSVLAALLDSVLDVVSQIILNFTEKHSSMSRSSAFYPAGVSIIRKDL